MKAQIKPRIDLTNRTRLETVIPLSTPYLVFLDPSDLCNAKCPWCPTGSGEALKYKRPQLMGLDIAMKIIDDLCDMPEPVKTLRLYADGEPLLNPDFVDILGYASLHRDRFQQIDTTTNGSLLSPQTSEKLVALGLDKIFISVPQGYGATYWANVRHLYRYSQTEGGTCEVYTKIIGDGLTEEAKQKFLNDFGDISDNIFIENLSPCWPEFDVGKIGDKGIYDQEVTEAVKVCPYIFYSVKINSDGTVSLCFLDWKHEMLIGDLKKESFGTIWNGLQLWKAQLSMLSDRSEVPNCRNCQQLKYGAPDNIDAFAEELIEKL